MSLPKPPSSLDNSCAVIQDNTLYTFSSEGFASLPLEQGAKWKKLAMGEKVTGAKCVGTDAGLYVVGGLSDSEEYAGLQKYTYATGEWNSITPTDNSLKNRQWHGATYIRAVDRILVYAGTTDNVQAGGSTTFTVQTSEPWQISSYGPNGDTQLTNPILLPWSDADALMVGGDSLSTGVSLFNQDTQWRPWTTLADPIPRDTSTMNAVLVNGDDGSKSLLIFDMGASPNTVKRVVLSDASGAPVANSAPVARSNEARDLTLSDWPEYNSTLASTASRTNYAIAQGADGKIVFAGGNADEPLAMFDTKENSWLDTSEVLVDQQKILAESETTTTKESKTRSKTSSTEVSTTEESSTEASTTTEASSTGTSSFTSTEASETASSTADSTSDLITSTVSSTAAATSSDAAAAGASSGPSIGSNVILGITLGSILGFLFILGLILLCLRRRRNRQNHTETGHNRKDSGMPIHTDEKKSRGFANGPAPPLSPGHFRGHQSKGSADSVSSMAILMGRMGGQKNNGAGRKASNDTARNSIDSDHKQFKSKISKPIPHSQPTVMEDREHEERILASNNIPKARPRNGEPPAEDGLRRSSGWNRYWSGGSALQLLGFAPGKRNTAISDQSSRYSEQPPMNHRATQDSATVPPLNFEERAAMNRVNTGSPVVSQHASGIAYREGMSGKIERPASRDSDGGYSSGIPESVNEAWDPTAADRPWGAARAPSSAYAPSHYYSTSLTPSSSASRLNGTPNGVSKQPQLAMASTSDMSWLNLGDQRRV